MLHWQYMKRSCFFQGMPERRETCCYFLLICSVLLHSSKVKSLDTLVSNRLCLLSTLSTLTPLQVSKINSKQNRGTIDIYVTIDDFSTSINADKYAVRQLNNHHSKKKNNWSLETGGPVTQVLTNHVPHSP